MLRESTASRSSSLMLTSIPSPPAPPPCPPLPASLAAVSSRSFAASASISATRARIAASSAASASSSASGASDEGAGAGGAAAVGALLVEVEGAEVGLEGGRRLSPSSIEPRRRLGDASVDMAGGLVRARGVLRRALEVEGGRAG